MQASHLSWRLLKLRHHLVRAVASRLYRDTDPDPGRTFVVAGSARSGTTWLAQLIRSQLPCRLMFEPFNPRLVAAYRRFHYFQYRRPGQDDPELHEFCRELFSGRIRDRWIDRQVDLLRPRFRLIKTVRGNLLLPWIGARFPEVPLLLVVRHPCAVVLSRMQLAWDTEGDIDPFLAQPDLIEDFFDGEPDLLRSAETPEEKHALIWAVHYLVPLRLLPPQRATVVFYEHLVSEPEREVERIFGALGQPWDDSALAAVRRPSTTAQPFSAVVAGGDPLRRWQTELSGGQIARVLTVVRRFGLESLYDEGTMPLVSASQAPGTGPEVTV